MFNTTRFRKKVKGIPFGKFTMFNTTLREDGKMGSFFKVEGKVLNKI